MRDSIEYCLGFIGRSDFEITLANNLSYLNAIICLLIALPLLAYQRKKVSHKWCVRLVTWVVVSVALASAALIFSGKYLFVHPYELIINTAFCGVVWFAQGNLERVCTRSS